MIERVTAWWMDSEAQERFNARAAGMWFLLTLVTTGWGIVSPESPYLAAAA